MTVPSTVVSVGDYVFKDCTGELKVNCDLRSISFSQTKFSSIVIGDGVTAIGNGSFSNCSELKSISIPESVTSIGMSAFYVCRNLTSVNLPKSITYIGEDAFYGCDQLKEIVVPIGQTNHFIEIFKENNNDNLIPLIVER